MTKLGLSDREQADFISFWLPQLKQKEFAFIQFIIDEDYQNHICKMNIEPKPNSMRRVYMLFTAYDQVMPTDTYKPQPYPSFIRDGYTLIEWGGTNKLNCEIFDYVTVKK